MGENAQDPVSPSSAPAKRSPLRAWGQLLRVPNLLTVPGDPLVGFLLATSFWPGVHVSFGRALAAAVASLLLYAAGLVHNDLCDLKEDRRERPGRPLPSGRIGLVSAWAAFALLALAGLALAALASWASLTVAVVLLDVVVLYNLFVKRLPLAGPLTMGLCRGLSILLGAAVLTGADWEGWCLWSPPSLWETIGNRFDIAFGGFSDLWYYRPVLAAAVGMTFYIAAVTRIARGETRAKPMGFAPILPAVILGAWLPFSVLLTSPFREEGPPISVRGVSLFLSYLAIIWAVVCADGLKGSPHPARVQRAVGGYIRGLLLIQAALAALVPWPGWIVAAVLLACWPIQAYLARRFYSS